MDGGNGFHERYSGVVVTKFFGRFNTIVIVLEIPDYTTLVVKILILHK